MRAQIPGWAVSNKALHLIILPTEGCNFRCVYCYENFAVSRMSAGIVKGVKRFLSRRFPELSRLDIGWFGGEPLLAKDIMVNVLEHVATLREEHPHAKFSSDITTNAYLLDASLLATLVGLGVTRLQVTLDGTAKSHDATRRRADGAGTFDVIWSNLLSMKASSLGFQTTIRLHIDQENQADIENLLRMSAVEFAGDPRFIFFIRPLARLGGPNDSKLRVLDSKTASRAVGALGSLARTLGLTTTSPTGADSVCYAARANSLVIRANGSLGKCTVALADPRNSVGRLEEDGTMVVDGPSIKPWMRGLWSQDPAELRCPLENLGKQDAKLVQVGRSMVQVA